MAHITFILKDGSRTDLEVPEGATVMQAAVFNDVRGIDGECGGAASCATCHVYVVEGADKLAPPNANEEGLLAGTAAERRPESRLGCQITVTAALDGLVLRVPERQA